MRGHTVPGEERQGSAQAWAEVLLVAPTPTRTAARSRGDAALPLPHCLGPQGSAGPTAVTVEGRGTQSMPAASRWQGIFQKEPGSPGKA